MKKELYEGGIQMKLKKWLKLSATLLALMLATACSSGQEDVNPQEEPVNSEMNEEDVPVNGEIETEDPASIDGN
jgi:hypothetical protein